LGYVPVAVKTITLSDRDPFARIPRGVPTPASVRALGHALHPMIHPVALSPMLANESNIIAQTGFAPMGAGAFMAGGTGGEGAPSEGAPSEGTPSADVSAAAAPGGGDTSGGGEI